MLSNHKDQLSTDLLNEEYGEMACKEVVRMYYGTSFYHRRPPQGLLTENYLFASPDNADGYPKTVANIFPEGGVFLQNATRLYSVHNFDNQADIPCRFQQEIRDICINQYVR